MTHDRFSGPSVAASPSRRHGGRSTVGAFEGKLIIVVGAAIALSGSAMFLGETYRWDLLRGIAGGSKLAPPATPLDWIGIITLMFGISVMIIGGCLWQRNREVQAHRQRSKAGPGSWRGRREGKASLP